MDSLPVDILHIILSRLSVRTLLRLTSVCKRLRDIVKDVVEDLSTNVSVVEPPRILLLFLPRRQVLQPPRSGPLFARGQVLWPPRLRQPLLPQNQVCLLPRLGGSLSKEPDRYDHVDNKFLVSFAAGQGANYSSCRGLLCLERDGEVLLFNPILGESISVPKPRFCLHNRLGCAAHWLGIGLHPVTHTYKIVHVGWQTKGSAAAPRAEVLDQGSKSWRKIESFDPRYDFSWAVQPVYVDGSIHWIAKDQIVSFCVAEEKFVSIPLPADTDHQLFNRLIDLGRRGLGLVEANEFKIHIWAMNEDGEWIMVYIIDLHDACQMYQCTGFEAVGCCGDYENIILKCKNSFFSYDSTEDKFEHEAWLPQKFAWHLSVDCHVLSFDVSLVSPVKLWNIENCGS